MTSQGGSKAADKSDWAPLRGRRVTIWPDHDEAGAAYATIAARILATEVRVVDVPADWPEKWDLADPLPDGASAWSGVPIDAPCASI
jgi:putative DNA primase/helicase